MNQDLDDCCSCLFILVFIGLIVGGTFYLEVKHPPPKPLDRVGELEKRVEALEKQHVEKQ